MWMAFFVNNNGLSCTEQDFQNLRKTGDYDQPRVRERTGKPGSLEKCAIALRLVAGVKAGILNGLLQNNLKECLLPIKFERHRRNLAVQLD